MATGTNWLMVHVWGGRWALGTCCVAAWRDQEKMDSIGLLGLVSGLYSEQLAIDLGRP